MVAYHCPDRYPIMAAMFRDYADAGLDAARTFVPKALSAFDAVLARHHKTTIQVLTGDCAIENCEHEDECPTVDFDICQGCYDRELEFDSYYGEQGVGGVAYPCPDVVAIENAFRE